MSVSRKILYINRRAPYGTIYAQEALEIVLLAAAFEHQVSIAFVDDGVFLLLSDQDTQSLDVKPFTATYRALADFQVHRLYVERESLQARGIDEKDLMRIGDEQGDGRFSSLIEVISSRELMEVLEAQDVCLNT